MITGSCLCGAVRYEITGPLEEMHHCHCSRCRKSHGAAFGTFAQVPAGAFRLVTGEGAVRRYRSSPPVERSFCATCGSNLTFRFDGPPEMLWVAAGTLDDDPVLRPGAHVFVASCAPWYAITDQLPRFDDYPPSP
jgi:hypothetical protein